MLIMVDDDFKPRLGRMRVKGSSRGSQHLARLIAATARTGTGSQKGHVFHGTRIGRGAGVGQLLSARDRHAGMRTRRVIVKTRLVKLAGKGVSGAMAHLRYIQRDGVTREGLPGELYGPDDRMIDGKSFMEGSDGDRHQFRFIVAVEDAVEYDDLKPYVRRLMNQMEKDLGTSLDWVAVDHFNTGHAHTHIMLRGKDDCGDDLVIAREYIANGMRARAIEIATQDLGPRTDLEIERHLAHEIDAERLTIIDRRLLRDMDAENAVAAGHRDPFEQQLRAGRLQTLSRLELASEVGGGRWRLADGLEDTLRQLGERRDIIRTMQRELTARGRSLGESIISSADGGAMVPVVGKVIRRGLSNELEDRHYLIVDGLDGKTHYLGIGKGDGIEPTPDGTVVRVTARSTGVRQVDRTVAEVAAANGGRYTVDLHLALDRSATEEFATAHVRRLEAMRRLSGGVEREPDGSWRISPAHLERAAAYEQRLAQDRPMTVEIVSRIPLERLARFDGATWLDRRLAGAENEPARDVGFGRDVRAAEMLRRQWLVDQNLLEIDDTQRIESNLLAILGKRELNRVAVQLSSDLQLSFYEGKSGSTIEGRLTRHVDLAHGKFAVIEKSKEFTLVPWRPVLEKQIGKPVSGIIRGDAISWVNVRGRSGPTMS
jgi:type IV secretory pathway VirD2 relaxase